jgi:homeobox protein cut-like
LSLPERAVWQLSRIVLATRTSRNLFALYCIALHVLVLGMLYGMGTVDVERSASHLGVAAGAAGAAGAASHGDWEEVGFAGAGGGGTGGT